MRSKITMAATAALLLSAGMCAGVPAADTTGLPEIGDGTAAEMLSVYIDENGDTAVIPAEFAVSEDDDEQTVSTGLVVIGPDGSEYVWIPTTVTPLASRDFGVGVFGTTYSACYDETDLPEYQNMAASTEKYGGFYIGRYEASRSDSDLPVSKKVTEEEPGYIWVQFSPQDFTVKCEELYAGNETVEGFFPWGSNWDTVMQWLIDSGCKTEDDIYADSSSWGNFSNDPFSKNEGGKYTGKYEEAEANNIYDLAGNNWEWTQERSGESYVMRGGGYNLMGGPCPGDVYPVCLRDALPGNNHHPNVTFRAALYIE